MSSIFSAHFDGIHKPEAISEGFLDRFVTRLQSGFFPMASPSRNKYEILSRTDHSIHFRSRGLLTSWNIGLNDVKVEVDSDAGEIRYEVGYGRWARIGFAFGCILFIFFVIAQYVIPAHYFPPEQYQYLFWLLVGFWCFVWPWVLTAMHKRAAEKCLTGILDEVNNDGI